MSGFISRGAKRRLQTNQVCITHEDGGDYVVLMNEHDDEDTVIGSYASLDEAVKQCGRYLHTAMLAQIEFLPR